MTDKQKQLLFLSTSYLQTFMFDTKEPNKYKDVQRLLNSTARLSSKYLKDLEPQLELAYKDLEDITNGEDIDCNVLVLGLGFIFVFAEITGIDIKLSNKIFKLGNKIYGEIEKNLKLKQDFRNANEIVSKFTKS